MTSLTFARLVAIERALRFRLTTPHPPLKDGIEHYERALDWAKEQRCKRQKAGNHNEVGHRDEPIPKAIPPPPNQKKRA